MLGALRVEQASLTERPDGANRFALENEIVPRRLAVLAQEARDRVDGAAVEQRADVGFSDACRSRDVACRVELREASLPLVARPPRQETCRSAATAIPQ